MPTFSECYKYTVKPSWRGWKVISPEGGWVAIFRFRSDAEKFCEQYNK